MQSFFSSSNQYLAIVGRALGRISTSFNCSVLGWTGLLIIIICDCDIMDAANAMGMLIHLILFPLREFNNICKGMANC